MSVVVQLRGGLGNQLFQYAAGFALSQRHSTDLVLDTALLPPAEILRGQVRRWTEQVSSFQHSATIVDSAASSAARKRLAQSIAGRERALGDSRASALLGSRVYAHESIDDLAQFASLPANARINAYCNSARFFSGYEDAIRRQVASLTSPGDWFHSERARLAADAPVAVHVRWGDYLNLKHVYGTVPADYYRRAVDLLAATAGDRPVWLFSDDPDGAEAYLSESIEIAHVVRPDSGSSALENIILLSEATSLVAANSSFSWWAAFLADRPPRSVVFPRPLFAVTGPPEPKEWLLADWMQLGRD